MTDTRNDVKLGTPAEPPPEAKRRRRPSGEKVRYAQRYAALRQRVDTALRLLRRVDAVDGPGLSTIEQLVKVAIETLEEQP